MRGAPTACRNARRGAIAVYLALSLTAVLGVLAVVLDGGLLLAERRRAQATADAAALAGAADLFQSYLTSAAPGQEADAANGTAHQSARTLAAANGYTTGSSTVVVRVSGDAPGTYLGGPNAGRALPAGYVEATVTYNEHRLFSGLWGAGTIPVSARAVARGQWAAGGPGMLVLGPSGTTVSMSNTASINLQTGSFVADSTGPNVFNVASATSNTITASAVDFVPSNTTANMGNKQPAYTVAPDYSQPSVSDPLAALTPPSASGLPTQYSGAQNFNTSQTLQPGIYVGGFTVANGVTVTLASGIYYIQDGSIKLNGGTLDGTSGVLLYVTTSGPDSFNMSSGVVNLKPLSSGPYQGISLWANNTATNAYPNYLSSAKVTMDSSSAWNLEGTIYAPKSALTMTGSSNTNDFRGSQIIVSTVTLTGTATIHAGDAQGVPALRNFQLVE